jgi:general secretion pathway protein N
MLGACLGLGYVVQDQLGRGPGLAPPSSAAAPPPRRAAPRATPIKAFSETLERPLFHASRKPAPKIASAAPEAAAVEPPVLDLVGVVIVPEGRSALIRMPRASELIEVSVGERIEGWRLESIETDRIVLKSGTASAVYRIDAELR